MRLSLLRPLQWLIAATLLALGAALVVWGRDFEGWDQAWRVEIGAALALLGPLYFAEELLRRRVAELSQLASESTLSYGALRRLLPPGDERTAVLDSLVAAVRDRARAGSRRPFADWIGNRALRRTTELDQVRS